jgi:hypothetical protein
MLASNGGDDSRPPTAENKPMLLVNAGGSVHGEYSPEQVLTVECKVKMLRWPLRKLLRR